MLEADPAAPADISRDTFLVNEAMKRQREARNFVYEGDVEAPKLTRSGKVVGKAVREESEVDEYGDVKRDKDEDEEMEVEVEDDQLEVLEDRLIVDPVGKDMEAKQVNMSDQGMLPLPPSARAHMINILSTLTSQSTSIHPPPFANEESNEPLHGLLNILRGTVERGEGNSALVVGARGVGKTRVSDFQSPDGIHIVLQGRTLKRK